MTTGGAITLPGQLNRVASLKNTRSSTKQKSGTSVFAASENKLAAASQFPKGPARTIIAKERASHF